MILTISASEFGRVRLFSLTPALAQELHDADDLGHALGRALGTEPLDAGQADLIAPVQLGELGLALYLQDGIGIPRDQLDTQALAAIDSPVLILRSAAFRGTARQLTPAPGITLVATYDETRDRIEHRPLSSDGAKGHLAAGAGPKQSQGAMMGKVAMGALAVLLALVVLMIVIGG